MKKYSVLVPAYNAEKYITQCIESIMTQSYSGTYQISEILEIIIANDGSTDSTEEICKNLAAKYEDIKVFTKENEGAFLTRKFLAEKAMAEYVIFLDADDKWEESLLQTIDNYIEKFNHPDIVSFGFRLWREEEYTPYNQISDVLYCTDNNDASIWEKVLCSDSFNSVCSKVIKKEVLTQSCIDKSLEKIRRGEDKLQLISCIENSENILFIPECLYDYRIDNISTTRSFKPDYFDEIIIVDKFALEKIKQYLFEDPKYYALWSSNFINKFFNYISDGAKSNIPDKKIRELLVKYKKHPLTKEAFKYAKGWKYKLKVLILKMNLYDLLLRYYKKR